MPRDPSSRAIALRIAGALGLGLFAQTVLEDRATAGVFLSPSSWAALTGSAGEYAAVPFVVAALPGAILLAALWLRGRSGQPLAVAGLAAGAWAVGSWFAVGESGLALQVALLWTQAVGLVAAAVIAAASVDLLPRRLSGSAKGWLAAVVAAFAAVSLALNVGLWGRLRVPHGDSAMYAEHLGNVLHGKGFRTYLDQGLFLGEHIQVIHLLLLPLYAVWPSHLLLEVAETLALAACGPLVARIARRHGVSPGASVMLAAVALLYPALNYLDIAIDLKTFRPITLGVPLMLWAIDALERRRFGEMALAAALALASKEDFALVLAPLGCWLLLVDARDRRDRIAGGALAIAGVAYLLLAVAVVIPAFRGGEQTHYALDYYPGLGKSAGEIVATCLTQPWIPLGKLLSATGLLYLAMLLLPLGGLPVLSPTRLAVAMPAIAITIFNKFAEQTPQPVHHFHAPAVPVLLWAMAAGAASRRGDDRSHPIAVGGSLRRFDRARFALAAAIGFAVVAGFGPLSLRFWDPGHPRHWSGYLPDKRAAAWPEVDALIPPDARVASTDFVRPRLMHRERSYDYGRFRRAIVGYEDRVPDDTEWIVIDRFDPYRTVGDVTEVREIAREPERWKIVRDDLFIVLRRRDDDERTTNDR